MRSRLKPTSSPAGVIPELGRQALIQNLARYLVAIRSLDIQ